MIDRSAELVEQGSASADTAYNRHEEGGGKRLFSQLSANVREAIESMQTGYDSNAMFNRKVGYCQNCNSNVVHVRAFESQLAYRLDRLTLGVLGLLSIGPWRCVDCGLRRMTLRARRHHVRAITETGPPVDETAAVSNFLRTDQSLVHANFDSKRFSQKFRYSVVEKLLSGNSSISKSCSELDISELELQLWLRDYFDTQIHKAEQRSRGDMIVGYQDVPSPMATDAGDAGDAGVAGDDVMLDSGPVIDSSSTRRRS